MTIQSPKRVLGYDLARAFAIAGMVVINFPLFLLERQDGAGAVAHWFVHLPSGRASALFVTLAGVGMALMTDGAEPRKVRRTLLLRALFLLVAGNLLITVWWIDILHHYAFYLALSALAFVHLPRRWLPPVGVIIVLLGAALPLAFPEVSRPGRDDYWTVLGMFQNVVGWGIHPLLPWAAFLVLGLWIGRHDLTDRSTRLALALRGALLAVAAPLVSVTLEASGPTDLLSLTGTGWSPDPLYVVAASGTSLLAVTLAQELVERWPSSWLTRALIAMGQISLTVYLWHALVGVGVPRWALGLEDAIGFGVTYAYVFAFVLVTIPLAWLWRRRFSRGPAEWLMRSVSGPTPPRTHGVSRVRLPAPPAWPWIVAVTGLVVVTTLRFVGTTASVGCPPPTGPGRGELTLTCERREHTLVVEQRADVTLQTQSGHDLYLELYGDLGQGERLLRENDDSGDALNPRLTATLAPGRYRVIVRPYRSALGGYLLERDDAPPTEERPGCTNTCRSSFDDECDDGGEDSLYDVCELGTDCADCGPREVR